MTTKPAAAADPRKHIAPHLGPLDVAAITAGIIIGSGIYRSPPDIARETGGPAAMLGLWIAGGIVALIGSLCYAELAAAWPHQGGTYVYLNKAFGRLFGFLYVWSEFWIVRPGNIGAMAFIFTEYAAQLTTRLNWPAARLITGCSVVVFLGAINLFGVRVGKRTQLLLTASKVAGLLAIFVVGMFATPVETAAPLAPAKELNPLLALVLVMFAYGGWNETAAVAAEVRDPQRGMLRGLVLGTVIVIATYLLVNVALLRGLGISGVAGGNAVAAELMSRAVGPWGARAISVLVCISCLGAINGMLFTGARLFYALGTDHRAFAWLGHWNERLGTPVRALALQTVVAVIVLVVLGRNSSAAFNLLVMFTTPVFWSFLLLVSVAVVVLRVRDPLVHRPFRLPFYPLEPIVFFLTSALMVYSGVNFMILTHKGLSDNASRLAFWFMAGGTLVVLVTGAVTYFATRENAAHGQSK